jgi:predicted ATPase
MHDSNFIRTPDQRLRVFVSSTLGELASERQAVRDAVQALRLTPVMFELGSRPHPPRELYRAYLAQSDVFVGVYWERYGWVAAGETVSGLEDEYDLSGALPKLIYIKSPAPEREPRLAALLSRIEADDRVSYKPFSTAAELRRLVQDDLALLLTERFDTARRRETATDGADRMQALPVPPTPLVGREREVDALGRLLLANDVREVTLTGPGGVGKTRLALAAGEQLRSRFDDGVVFVGLGSVTAPELVPTALAGSLGVLRSGGQPPIDNVTSYLADKRLTLVIDNFEQVSEAAPVVVDLLAAAPGVKVLTTSRNPLRISGEHEFPVPPLSLPQAGAAEDVEGLTHYEAVALFVERAQAARPGFELTAANADAVAETCRRLDGLPLAVELAAARVRILPPEALLARLNDTLGLLTGGPRDLPERQRALRSTIAWSYDLLKPDERGLFAWLGVFAGGFDLAAVEGVWEAGSDVLDALGSLVEDSLVRRGDDGGEPRFTMLETIREYAIERLREGADWQAAHDRHAAYFLALAQHAEPELMGHGQLTWLERLETERDNLRAALSHFLERDQIAQAVLLAKSLLFWWLHARAEEGVRWTERIAARSGSLTAPVRGLALTEAGVMAFGNEEPDRAQSLLEESWSLFREAGLEGPIVVPITILGQLATQRGDYARATELLEDGLVRSRNTGGGWYTAMQLNFLGQIPQYQGDHGKAVERFEEALSLSREVGDRYLILLSIANLVRARQAQGDPADLTEFLEEGLSLADEVGDDVSIAYYLEELAAVAERRDDTERAGRLHGAAGALRAGLSGNGWLHAIGSPTSELSSEPLSELTRSAFDRASAEGAAMGRRPAVEYALGRRE